MAGRIILQGAIGYKPIQQGDLDGLCGVYAIINAACIVSAPTRPLTRLDVGWLMKSAVQHLDHKQVLANTFVRGMSAKRQRKLARFLLKGLCDRTGVDLRVRSQHSNPDDPRQTLIFEAIKNSLQQGAAVMIRLQNTHNHFTVVVGCSTSRLYVADSDGLHWLSRQSFGACEDRKTYRNCVYLADIFKICPA